MVKTIITFKDTLQDLIGHEIYAMGFRMKETILLLPLILTTFAFAETPTQSTVYYSGTAQILNLFSGITTSESLIMERIVDPQASTITELACGKDPGKPTFQSPMYMKISGNSVVLSDTQDFNRPKKVSGTGTVQGQPWIWNYLDFSMTYHSAQGDSKIKDVNFLIANMIVARKQIFTPSGIPAELYDINMTAIDKTTYQNLYDNLGCGLQSVKE